MTKHEYIITISDIGADLLDEVLSALADNLGSGILDTVTIEVRH